MKFSSFGNFLTSGSGILTLMEDIDSTLNSSAEMRPLGGGNPARIPEMQRVFRDAMNKLLADGEEFERLAGKYDGARGNARFIDGLATLLQSRCGWDVGPQNIAITNGSQSSFYVLFHLFAGEFNQGKKRKILLPLAPEYIGYADVGMGADLFHTYRPTIELRGDREFKYHVDFAHLDVSDEIGAIAVSRPTNPTGNVLTDAEVAQLRELAIRHEVPFILDSAYVGPNKPASRGSVSVSSDDPRQHPKVLFNYLTAEKDIADWRACIELTREILGQSAMDRFRGQEIAPGERVRAVDDIDAWVRQNVESAYHPSCTCKMGGDDDPDAVLDANCRVRGTEQLRVVDSSIFPTITNGNLNAPTIMAAERAADLITGKLLLAPMEAPVWIDPSWQQAQRAGQPQRELSCESGAAP